MIGRFFVFQEFVGRFLTVKNPKSNTEKPIGLTDQSGL